MDINIAHGGELSVQGVLTQLQQSGIETWMLGGIASATIASAYFAISYHILGGVYRTSQWGRNPLAVATGLIFFSCALGHGLHAVHMALPFVGLDITTGLATRTAFAEWHTWGWEAVTAGVGIYYWTMRSRFPALVRGSALFEDMKERQRNALEIHDNVVQSLARAKLALDLGKNQEGYEALSASLENSRRIITDLLGDEDAPLKAGDLARERAAGERP